MKNKFLVAGLSAITLLVGIVGANFVTQFANAADTASNTVAATTNTTAIATTPAPDQNAQHNFDPTKGGHVGANGQKEALLTGDTADKVTAAAQKAVPGATILRVEADAEGSPYEAHMKKSDGSLVTVKVDSNFSVTSTQDGMR